MGADNGHEKHFPMTGSTMYFHTPEAACSRSMTHLVIDEAAFIPNMAEHWMAVFPTISAGGKCFAVSSVSRAEGWFRDKYEGAVNGTNAFKVFECDYRENERFREEQWRQEMKRNIGEENFSHEFECVF